MRPLLLALTLGLAVDATGAALISQFSDEGEKLQVFFGVLAAMIIIPIISGLWVFTKTWAIGLIFEKDRLARYYLAEMNRLDMPEATTFFAADDYLGFAALDETASNQARAKAAIWLGELLSLNHLKPLSSSVIHRMALSDAMQRYRRAYRPRPAPFDEDEFVAKVENDIWTVR